MTQTRLIGVGVFVIGGILLFAVGLFMIGNRRMLFQERFELYAEFVKVTGLQQGATVRVSGMDAGEVEAILLPPGPSSKFRLRMRIREDLHQLVRRDSIATIQTDGLVGSNFVQVNIGTERAPEAPAGSTIPSREPFDFAELMQQASGTVKTLEETIVQLRGNVEETLGAISDTANRAGAVIDDVGKDITAISADGQKVAADIRVILADVREGKGTVGKLVNDDELYSRAAAISREAQQTMVQLRKAVEEGRGAIANLNTSMSGQESSVQGMAVDLRQTMASAREAMADLADNAESLKRSFLFRGMFRGRGFYDLDGISIEDYRGGEFAGKNREPLRIWLDASVLFTRTKEGHELLTEEGRKRLDSAMGTFVHYPKQMPLMIEGYSPAPTTDAAHIASATRATLVREYLIRRFSLNPNTTGLMPMGMRADGSPRGDNTWDGIGLTLWMRRDLFATPGKATAAGSGSSKGQDER